MSRGITGNKRERETNRDRRKQDKAGRLQRNRDEAARVAVLVLREIAAGHIRFNESVEDVVTAFIAERKLEGFEAHPRAHSRSSAPFAGRLS